MTFLFRLKQPKNQYLSAYISNIFYETDEYRNLLFTAHVSKIANHAIANYGVKPIIWHDMLVNFMEVGTIYLSIYIYIHTEDR